MILIGQYDSPFVRRVGIALVLYDIAFEHRTWSAFGDANKIRAHNPLGRVPTLVLDDGAVLVDSHSMIDYLDGLAPPERVLFPRTEPARRQAQRVAALAMGMGDKAVSTFYEARLHDNVSQLWLDRCRAQILGVMGALEAERAARTSPYWFGERIGHADIGVTVVLRFMAEALPGLVPMADYPALAAHAQRLEALPVFKTIAQPFVAPT